MSPFPLKTDTHNRIVPDITTELNGQNVEHEVVVTEHLFWSFPCPLPSFHITLFYIFK